MDFYDTINNNNNNNSGQPPLNNGLIIQKNNNSLIIDGINNLHRNSTSKAGHYVSVGNNY